MKIEEFENKVFLLALTAAVNIFLLLILFIRLWDPRGVLMMQMTALLKL